MTTGHVFIATSLDGFVARKDHSLDWLMKQEADPADTQFADFIATVDGLIMGAGTFRTVVGFGEWPYPVPVVVMSRSMTDADIPERLTGKVRISNRTPNEIMADVESEGWKRAYVDGGNLVQSFLREGLIEDLEITVIPILIGDGISLFGPLDADRDLDFLSATPKQNGLVTLRYRLR